MPERVLNAVRKSNIPRSKSRTIAATINGSGCGLNAVTHDPDLFQALPFLRPPPLVRLSCAFAAFLPFSRRRVRARPPHRSPDGGNIPRKTKRAHRNPSRRKTEAMHPDEP